MHSFAMHLLMVPHFHLVFTLPAELRLIVRNHQKELFNCLFNAAVYALFKLLAEPRFAGGLPGMIGVLHTWTKDMNYHPHLQFLVPAGVIREADSKWIPIKKKKFLVPIGILSDIFRARFMKLARKVLPPEIKNEIPQSIWKKRWVVYPKPFIKGGKKILEYLARYIFKIAISNNRILSDKNGQITFKYQNSKTGKWKTMALDAEEFLRRFLQHVLPRGFHKVRSYGFFAPKYKEVFESIRKELENSMGNPSGNQEESDIEKHYRRCPQCKTGIMKVEVHIYSSVTENLRFHWIGPPWKN